MPNSYDGMCKELIINYVCILEQSPVITIDMTSIPNLGTAYAFLPLMKLESTNLAIVTKMISRRINIQIITVTAAIFLQGTSG